MKSFVGALVVTLLAFPGPVARAQCDTDPQAKLTAADAAKLDTFGTALGLDGDVAVIGAPGRDLDANGTADGLAYVYQRNNGVWSAIAKLTSSLPTHYLATSAAISGNTIVLGQEKQETVLVYEMPLGGWVSMTETARLSATDAGGSSHFGGAVAVSGSTIIAGAFKQPGAATSERGAAYVYERPAGGWVDMTETAKLTASDAADLDWFGYSVAISGSVAVVGQPVTVSVPTLTGPGAAYVFVKPAGGWTSTTESAKLTATNGAALDHAGTSVSIDGSTIVMGSPYHTIGAAQQAGSVYVFEQPAGGWASMTESAEMTAAGGSSYAYLGISVSISGGRLVAGASNDVGGRGSAYVFEATPVGWVSGAERTKLIPADAGIQQIAFGWAVGMSGSTALIGAPKTSPPNLVEAGAAYVHVCDCGNRCPPNGIPEGEACLLDINGGCNSVPPRFSPIHCGDTICGSAWASLGVRDTDWYELVVPPGPNQLIHFHGIAEFPLILGVVNTGGVPSCALATDLSPFATAGPCDEASITACLTPGTWWLFVAPTVFIGYPCEVEALYHVTLDCLGDCTPPCQVPCPVGAIAENESCGQNSNGGCNSQPPQFDVIDCGETICGTAWADGDVRDTDWYQFVVQPGANEQITLTAVAEFPIVIGIVNTGGIPLCNWANGLSPSITGAPCQPTVLTTCLTPGTWWIFAAPSVYNGYPCGASNRYTLSLACTGDCTTPPPVNDECLSRIDVFDGATPFSTLRATDSGPPLPSGCDEGFGLSFVQDIWFTYTATCTGVATVSTCNSANFDTRLAVYAGSCNALALLDCNDDAPGCAGFTSTVHFDTVCRATYFIRVGGYGGAGFGILNISCQGTCPTNCDGDLNNDRNVNGADLGILLGNWGGRDTGDLNGDGVVDGADLSLLLAHWGPCGN